MVLTILRNVGAWFAGAVAGVLAVVGLEAAGHAIWPPPPGLDLADAEALKAAIAGMPLGALVAVVVAWVGGAVAGAAVGTALASYRRVLVGALDGGLTLVGTLANLAMIPHPAWMMAVGPSAVLLGMGAGAWLGMRVPVIGARG